MNYVHDAEITGAYSKSAVANVSKDFDAGLSNIQNARSLSVETDKLKSAFEFALLALHSQFHELAPTL